MDAMRRIHPLARHRTNGHFPIQSKDDIVFLAAQNSRVHFGLIRGQDPAKSRDRITKKNIDLELRRNPRKIA